jgi:hypothetical protein
MAGGTWRTRAPPAVCNTLERNSAAIIAWVAEYQLELTLAQRVVWGGVLVATTDEIGLYV